MPIIHENPWLIEQLLAAAQAAAPPVPSALPLQQQQQEVADALHAVLNNLKEQLDPAAHNAVEHAGAADLASTHMESMGDFVHWLVSNGTKIGGAQIVYPGNVQRPSEDYGYYKIEPGTEIVVPLARPDRSVVAYWINADALKKYLISLQSDEKLRTNVMFQVQLLKLVQDANKQLDADISEKYEAPEKPDNYPIDQVPRVLVANDSKQGSELLTYGDLKSRESLTSWLTGHNIGLGSAQNTLATNPDKFDLCGAVNVLYYRATRHLQLSARAEDTERFKLYVARLQKLSSEMSCQLTGQPGQQGTNQSGDSASGGKAGPVDLGSIAGILPFNANYIDFRQILAFVDNYAAWAQANNRPEVTAAQKQVHDSVDQANRVLATPNMAIQISNLSGQRPNRNTPSSFEVLCKNANQAVLLANFLTSIVSIGGRLLQDFAVVYEHGYGAGAARAVKQNISPQQTNLADLRNILTHLQRPGPGQ